VTPAQAESQQVNILCFYAISTISLIGSDNPKPVPPMQSPKKIGISPLATSSSIYFFTSSGFNVKTLVF